MIDRITNLLVLFIIAAALLIFSFKLSESWKVTAPWEQEWHPKEGMRPTLSIQEILSAMREADAIHEHDDLQVLKKALESEFIPTGVILVRLSSNEIYEALIRFVTVLGAIVFPICLNYVRHGKFRLWNRENAQISRSTT
jgi:hypothetical protein